MHKKKSVAVALVSTAIAGVAHAQSSVTLYGLIDAGFGYVNTNQGSRYAMMNGNLNGDRWGLKGAEDLGGGLAAIFQIENGFNVGTGALGQGGREFGRQSWVGLTSASVGTLKLGRQYDPTVDTVQGLTLESVLGSPATTPGDVDNNDNSARISNAIKYVSPLFGGVQFEGLYALNGVAGKPGSGNTYSAAASYTGGPLSIAAGYLHGSNTAATPGALRTTWSGTMDSIFDGPVSNGYQTAASIGIAHVAARYKLSAVTVGAGYSYAAFNADAQSTFKSQEHFNSGKVYALYQLTPSLLGGIGYIYTRSGGDTSATYNQVTAGASYALSKRTDFYAVGAYQHATGTQRTTGGALADAVASVGSYGLAGNGNSQTLVVVGMRHRF
ncbi:porin [Paraburkholderia sprentiae WSM5005]|uniref:Porin n=1 Tax=Paraburkholderia sprentiae WSM5005 TaxID=754502 RepID=A0A1I9YT44_9BURK|nr:porin [Paraburkholderia sprentiae]APA89375.1 porin [Paraburkholderia sprentiae WSM5005]